MSTPLVDPSAFAEHAEQPRKLSGRLVERSPYYDLVTKVADSGKGQITPKTLNEDEYVQLSSDLRTAVRQVNADRLHNGQGALYVSTRRVVNDPKNGKRVKQGTQFLWFKITDKPGRKTGPRVDRSNAGQSAPEGDAEDMRTDQEAVAQNG